MIRNIEELHGKKSKCGKFTINIDKGYLAVACNFYDGKDRIVYSEPITNINNILKDLYNIWNFKKYILVKECNTKLGIEILVDSNNMRVLEYNRKDGKVTIYSQKGARWFQMHDDWEKCVEYACDNHNCSIKSI